ncbi:MAG: hypothetical protein KAV48_03400 [Methanomicrobia archaeon]|nr:hypothetical protein [Methanomicrobia archaeon]MCK4310349.1 hypothetical protein [Methanomicrobia archaeon]MCK4432958.1 hypothetical protein [Methanomicrobia archaeon]MCK4637774.1 hypothetical protein [Methanomicrobia archaeon]
MSLEKIISKIEKDAEKEIAEINERIKIKKEELIEKAEKKARLERDKIINRGKKEAELEKQRIISSTNVETKRKILNKKDQLIMEVISEISKKIVKDKKIYQRLLRKLVDEAQIEDYEILVREGDRDLVKEYTLAKEGIKEPGVIIRKKDQTLTVDSRIEKIIKRKEKDTRIGIAKILFESE